jgi:hypothetical protein
MVAHCLTVTVQETTASALKQTVPRAFLVPVKGHRRGSLDVSTHVLATPVTPSADAHIVPSPAQRAVGIRGTLSAAQTHWTPAWTKALQVGDHSSHHFLREVITAHVLCVTI